MVQCMALLSFSVLFSPMQLLLLLLLVGANSACEQFFPCGDLKLEFPFTNSTNPGCGLIRVDGCDSISIYEGTPTPKTISGPGYNYTILNKISSNQISVQDTTQPLLDFLGNQNCDLLKILSVPQFPPLSFTFSPNITLFTCFNQNLNEEIEEYFRGYHSFDCQYSVSTVYYNGNLSAALPAATIPTECSTVQLPIKRIDGDLDDLISLLTPNFTLEWSVPQGCSRASNDSNQYDCTGKGNSKDKKIIFIVSITIAALTSTYIFLFLFIRRVRAKEKQENEKDIELFLKNNGNLAPMRYKYSNIKKMTKSFSESLGKGGYGSVYKGQFPDGHLVAVKVLNESDGNGEEFMNEVASISRTSHINIVALLGFCFEGSKRALIYDYMPNGSLEKFIGSSFNSASAAELGLGWEKLFEIALGIARGLEYLHQGCNTRILHLDIKPQNILLDKDFNPRISDFGLAKLCPNRSSIVSMMVARGTIGYIAPEVFSRNFGEVSYKSDVYSYGMLVLDMIGGRKNIDPRDVDHTSEIYFPNYIYKQLEMDAERDIGDLVGTMSEDESQVVKKRNLIIVGLWCIQTNPKDRPSMTKVVEMLEGKLGALEEVPPKPYLCSPPRSAQHTISTSTSESL